jgi:hypothetical protein
MFRDVRAYSRAGGYSGQREGQTWPEATRWTFDMGNNPVLGRRHLSKLYYMPVLNAYSSLLFGRDGSVRVVIPSLRCGKVGLLPIIPIL